MNTELKGLEKNLQILKEEINQKEIAFLEENAIMSEDYYNLIFRKFARVLCNGCGEPILSFELEDFHKNDGYCNSCNRQ